MKTKFFFFSLIFSIFTFGLSAQSSVFVLGFETQDYEIADKMDFFADSLRTELAKSSKVQVVDRNNVDKVLEELNFQMTDLTSSQNVKSVGEMLNADFMVLGKVEKLDALFKQSKYSVVVQMLNVENAQIVGGATAQIKNLADFPTVVPNLARSLLVKIQDNSSFGAIIPSANMDVNKELFVGKWEVEIAESDRIDLYTFDLQKKWES